MIDARLDVVILKGISGFIREPLALSFLESAISYARSISGSCGDDLP